jgi:CheY-like chemotaxis protein/DNA-binding XRE family transcriptional regulator
VGIDDVKKSFGASVRIWRDRLGVSQEELAERAGLHRTYISDVERGARNVSLESIERLAGALEISVAMLLSYERSGSPASQSDVRNEKRTLSDRMVDILFVEDSGDDVEMTLRALQRANLANKIHIVHDGASALDYLFSTGEYALQPPASRPDIILLDLGLPKIDGLEVLRRIKTDARTASIPVIVLTASKQNRDVTTSKKLGADAYILKPVDFDNLSKVTSQLSLKWALLKPAASLNM